MADELNGATEPKRGRPKGSQKPPGSGRKKGTPNKNTSQNRERVAEEADPLGFWISVALGKRQSAAPETGAKKRTWVMPTFEDQKEAMLVLINRVMPVLRSQELSGPAGGPIEHVEIDAVAVLRDRLAGIRGRLDPEEAKPP